MNFRLQELSVYTLMKIHNRGKFHQYSICDCKVNNFQSFMYRFSIHEIALFGKFLGPYFPSMVQYYRYSQQRQYSSKQKHCLNIFEGFDSLWEKDGPKVGTFGPTMTLLFLLKMAKIEKNKQQCRKMSVIELSKYVKMKSLSHLLFREKCNYFLQYLGYFYQGNRAGSQFKGVESKFDKYYFIHAIPGQLPV